MATDVEDKAQTNLQTQGRMGELIGTGQFDKLSEVLTDDFVDHDPAPDQPAGPSGIGAFWQSFGDAFSEIDIQPAQVIATEDFVTAVLSVSAKHTGTFLGHEATGKTFTVRGIQVAKFEDGKIVERWGSTDQLGILQQLGLA
ncbi:ester cyclase [uncultured Amnibacterium sp.]|uniref:ester cyclase n=1 Tax=uncultured Amnibacterium sp. TaxID=1631851 RepID=UPI0035CBDEEB